MIRKVSLKAIQFCLLKEIVFHYLVQQNVKESQVLSSQYNAAFMQDTCL